MSFVFFSFSESAASLVQLVYPSLMIKDTSGPTWDFPKTWSKNHSIVSLWYLICSTYFYEMINWMRKWTNNDLLEYYSEEFCKEGASSSTKVLIYSIIFLRITRLISWHWKRTPVSGRSDLKKKKRKTCHKTLRRMVTKHISKLGSLSKRVKEDTEGLNNISSIVIQGEEQSAKTNQ